MSNRTSRETGMEFKTKNFTIMKTKFAIKGQNGLYLNKQMTAFNIAARALGAANCYIAHFDTEEAALSAFRKTPVMTSTGVPHKITVVKRTFEIS